MTKKIKITFLVLALIFPLLFQTSCSSGQQNNEHTEKANMKEHLIQANKIFMNNQSDAINEFIKRHELVMDTTSSGLRIKIAKKGNGIKPTEKNKVTINYIVSLLDGTECYRSDSLGELTFSMNYDDVPGGLREAVSMMSVGDKALAILPSHLGYGLTGDADKIPSNAVLVYQIELLKIE